MSKILFILFLFSFSATANVQEELKAFEKWKLKYMTRAAKRGLPKKFLQPLMDEIKLDPEVIEKDRNQITSNTEIDYRQWIVKWMRNNPTRIEMAKEHMQKNLELLKKVEAKYKVDKEIIVSLWAVESLFGQIMGDYDLLNSLATLAFEGRRSQFFELQLNAALRLIYKGHVDREHLKGSWAGATGQCQFMPSNIQAYARDFDGDGKKDIWTNPADIFASIANLLKKSGWKYQKEVGSLVFKTKENQFSFDKYRTPEEYAELGVVNWDGHPLKGKWKRAAEEVPFKNSPIVLRGSNYQALMKWNKSSLFAALNIIIYDSLKE